MNGPRNKGILILTTEHSLLPRKTLKIFRHEWCENINNTKMMPVVQHDFLRALSKIGFFFFQPYSPHADLVIVLQTPSMRDNLQEHGRDIVFMDATHGVSKYGFPLFTVVQGQPWSWHTCCLYHLHQYHAHSRRWSINPVDVKMCPVHWRAMNS